MLEAEFVMSRLRGRDYNCRHTGGKKVGHLRCASIRGSFLGRQNAAPPRRFLIRIKGQEYLFSLNRHRTSEFFAAEVGGRVSCEAGEAAVELGERLITDVKSDF